MNIDITRTAGRQETEFPDNEFPPEDGVPMDTPWHRAAINLLIDVVVCLYEGRSDYYVGGNMFIYFSQAQRGGRGPRGPDFFLVKNVEGSRYRRSWKIDVEGGRFPNVIMELLSESTRDEDLTTKKDIYEQTFQTPEYFCWDPDTNELSGWRLVAGRYESLVPNEKGWLWSEEIGAWLGPWTGSYLGQTAVWPRFFDVHGNLLLTAEESQARIAESERRRAETERRNAEAERQRAKDLEAEVERLRKLFSEKPQDP